MFRRRLTFALQAIIWRYDSGESFHEQRRRPETAALLRRHLDSTSRCYTYTFIYSRAFSETGLLHRLDWAQIGVRLALLTPWTRGTG